MSSTLTFIKNMELPIYFFNNRFKTKTFSKFPFFTFNDGVPCLALNSYIQSEEIIKLSDETIFKTAYSLTHIIRFCENNKIKFSHFTENDFVAFSHSLQVEDRENKTTVFILSNTLNFFNYFGCKFLDIENYCIDILHCFYKKHITKSNKETKSLYHVCFRNKIINQTYSNELNHLVLA